MMTKNYEVQEFGTIVLTDEEGNKFFIPTDPANSDYQAYLEWLAEQKPAKKAPAQDDEAHA